MLRGLLLAGLLLAGGASAGADAGSEDWSARRQERAAGKTRRETEQQRLLGERYRFSGALSPVQSMTGGKPLAVGPVAASTRAYLPLPHPAPDVGHFLFPGFYLLTHPELKRVDAGFDLPAEYLPEYPPRLYLTTRADLGDLALDMEVNAEDFRTRFSDLLTPLQLEGLRLLVTPRPSLWFNGTEHRLTAAASRGVSCFACHVNGHTNGAVLLEGAAPKGRERARLDTPSLRGAGRAKLLSARRSFASMEDFLAKVDHEDYLEGDVAVSSSVGPHGLDAAERRAMAAFLALIDFPPAPALKPSGRLDAAKATPAELAGETLFFGKARCASCHPAPDYSDYSMHDLRGEAVAGGRPEGAFRTPTLRGIKDSPPYHHDGRLPTLEDSVRFFDAVMKLDLTEREKGELTAFLKAL